MLHSQESIEMCCRYIDQQLDELWSSLGEIPNFDLQKCKMLISLGGIEIESVLFDTTILVLVNTVITS